ncbi:MAG: hypothetical protein ABDI20_07375 [Candidatus Bipolaricaulaceae bacterium]
MPHAFTEEDFGRIAQVLGAPYQREGNTIRFVLHNEAEGRKLVLEICPELQLEGGVQAQDLRFRSGRLFAAA